MQYLPDNTAAVTDTVVRTASVHLHPVQGCLFVHSALLLQHTAVFTGRRVKCCETFYYKRRVYVAARMYVHTSTSNTCFVHTFVLLQDTYKLCRRHAATAVCIVYVLTCISVPVCLHERKSLTCAIAPLVGAATKYPVPLKSQIVHKYVLRLRSIAETSGSESEQAKVLFRALDLNKTGKIVGIASKDRKFRRHELLRRTARGNSGRV